MSDTEYAKLEDQALVRLATQGDRTALEMLLERHASTAVSFACSILTNREDALDAAQTALLQAARTLKSEWQGRSFKACLYVLTHNAAVDVLSQNASRRRREKAVGENKAMRESEMPGERIERKEELVALREELAALPAETASLLALYHLDGVPVAMIANQMALTVDA